AYGFYGRRPGLVMAAAAGIAAIVLGIWNIVLQQRLDRSHEAQRGIALHGATGSMVLGASGQGTLVVTGLAAAPQGKTYEAWVIAGSKAEPAGLFGGGGRTVVVHLGRPVRRGAIVGVTV